MDGWKDGTIVPTFQRSIGPPDPLAHSPGRHPPGAAGGGPAPDLRPRLLDRPREDARPLDATCDCETCTTFSRGYLRHLFVAEELLGLRLLSLHNVRFLIRLAAAMRAAIRAGTFPRWAAEWRHRYTRSD